MQVFDEDIEKSDIQTLYSLSNINTNFNSNEIKEKTSEEDDEDDMDKNIL